MLDIIKVCNTWQEQNPDIIIKFEVYSTCPSDAVGRVHLVDPKANIHVVRYLLRADIDLIYQEEMFLWFLNGLRDIVLKYSEKAGAAPQ